MHEASRLLAVLRLLHAVAVGSTARLGYVPCPGYGAVRPEMGAFALRKVAQRVLALAVIAAFALLPVLAGSRRSWAVVDGGAVGERAVGEDLLRRASRLGVAAAEGPDPVRRAALTLPVPRPYLGTLILGSR